MVRKITLIMSLLILSGPVLAELSAERLREDKTHVKVWNNFARQVLALHEKQIARYAVRKTVQTGGYHNQPDFYLEESYYDTRTGKLVSRVRWEKDNPRQLHTVEVNILDDQGRVLRDFTAAYLPDYHNAPVQTLIDIHHYNGGLHSFRQYDAGGDLIYEFCEGTLDGRPVQIRLFEDDLFGNDPEIDKLMAGADYKACFGGMSARVGEYINPH